MIGAPVTTVRTPALLESWFAGHGTDARVEVRHLEPDLLVPFVESVRRDGSVDGLLVTMPHKQAILPLLDRVDPSASASGSVNAVRRADDGALEGAQFDGIALVGAVEAAGIDLARCRVCLAGLGGAGLAIALALLERDVAELRIVEPDAARAATGVAAMRGLGAANAVRIGVAPSKAELLVNATPLGMRDGDPSPFDEDVVRRARHVADIVADPPATRLAALARAHGRTLVTGRDMVRAQIVPIGSWLRAVAS